MNYQEICEQYGLANLSSADLRGADLVVIYGGTVLH